MVVKEQRMGWKLKNHFLLSNLPLPNDSPDVPFLSIATTLPWALIFTCLPAVSYCSLPSCNGTTKLIFPKNVLGQPKTATGLDKCRRQLQLFPGSRYSQHRTVTLKRNTLITQASARRHFPDLREDISLRWEGRYGNLGLIKYLEFVGQDTR